MVNFTADEMKLAYSYTRFSSPAQKEGDSARRQLQAAKKWCEENGYILSDERFLDEGKSGYKGMNLQGDGDLKRFIDLIEAGKIKPGSVLILESFDRFSRMKASKTVPLFLDIISSGIGMVFTMTFAKQLITEKVLDENDYILSAIVGEAQRSHHESKIKSERVSDAYKERKKAAIEHGFKTLAWCPPWCDFDQEKGYVENTERANIVRRIYDEYLKGNGPFRISRMFNAEKISTLGHRGFKAYKNTTVEWYKKTVRDFLFDKRVYGFAEFLEKENYFPVIIKREKFNAVQNRLAIRENATPTGGPIGGTGNLFTGVCRCVHCGDVMAKTSTRKHYKNKVTRYEYLVCDGARSGMGCSYHSIPYALFEKTFLNSIHTDAFCAAMTESNPGKPIQDHLDNLQGEQITNDKQIQKLRTTFLKVDKPPMTLLQLLSQFETRQIEISKEIQLATAKLKVAESLPANLSEMIQQTDKLIQTKEGRLKVREFIRNTVDRIELDTTKNPINYQIYFKEKHVCSVVIWTEREEHESAVQIFQSWPGVVKEINWQRPISYLNDGLSSKDVDRILNLYAKRRTNE